MKKSLLIALFAAMPLMAQEAPQKPECAPQKPCCRKMVRPARPQLTEEQKAEMKAKFEAKKAEMKAKFMEKFDADKDGQLSDAEKEAIKAEFAKRGGKKGPKFGKKGPRRPGCGCGKKGQRPQRPQLTEEQKAEMKAKFMEKFDADKDGKISDAEKEAIKAEFQKRARARRCGGKCKKH